MNENKKRPFDFFKTRRFRRGSFASIITLSVLVLVIVLNMLLSALSEKYTLAVDLTPSKVFGLTQPTTDFLNQLDKDVTVYILNTSEAFAMNGDYLKQAAVVIERYQKESSHIKVEYIDLITNPAFLSRFPNITAETNSIIISSGDKYRSLSPYDLFNIESNEYGYSRIASSKAEQAMTSSIYAVTSSQLLKVAVILGQNEVDTSAFTEMLKLNNYEIVPVNILTQEIPSDIVLAIVSAPARDYADEQIKRLEAFLKNGDKYGKTLFYLAGVDQPPTPLLDTFLQSWGIKLGDGVIFETDQSRLLNLNPFTALVDYSDPSFAGDLPYQNLYATVPAARALSLVETTDASVTPLLSFSQTAVVQPLDADQNWQPSADNLASGTPALILSSKVSYSGSDIVASNLLLCSSNLALDQAFLSSGVISNSQYFLKAVDLLVKREDAIAITPKDLSIIPLGLNGLQVIIAGGVFIVLIPLITLIIGGVIFFRRRHL